ncbi:hypothetical protein LRP67_17620 [Nocardioides sp. cx-169]|uniref:hypothetical protein n=1 Tax=Nocardioides sp. cx-169 TaxID=2899080 RepID=UPI001E33D39A|nr:hypothetical protein [Nocardioides sp. cx-169]MCD4535910.1 hypothetical protein [Nocardioides sp. cx-169]
MMTTKRAIGAAIAASFLLIPTHAASAAPDDAARAGKNFQKVMGLSGAQLQACKTPAGAGKYRVFARLDNRKGAGPTGGQVRVLNKGEATKRKFNSGLVKKGRISRVGSVVIANKPGFRLEVSVFQSQMGNGGTRALAKIKPC